MSPTPDSTLADLRRTIADLRRANTKLQRKLEDRSAERDEAFAQQAATSDVLKTISRSAFDLQQVLDTLCETAARLCESDGAGIALREGRVFRYAAIYATYGIDEYSAFLRQRSFEPGRDTTIGRVALEGDVVHIADIAADPEYALPQSTAVGRIRTNLGVPLLRDDLVVGMLTLFRQRVEPFTKRQIELVQTFAAQAVIAMENARLVTETREALDQQTATAEVLGVINSSPGDLAPVFDAMLEKAMRLCGGSFGSFATFDGEVFWAVAHRNVPPELVEALREPIPPTPGGHLVRIVDGETVVHVTNFADSEAYRSGKRWAVALVDKGGAHTAVWVALRKDAALLGTMVIYRQELQPFSEKQIALLQNFAAQAVIAIENARLITETREALEQQTATAEVLGVINSSPGDLAPVFDAMLEKAMHLCGAAFGQLHTYDGEGFPTVALRGLPIAYAEYQAKNSPTYGPGTAPWRIVQGEHVVHLVDLANSEAYRAGDAARRATVDLGGCHTLLTVALRREDTLLGTVSLYRQEARPFSEKQIALLQNFAAQAVIAMENARLITETREALDQQTATADILGVISGSPTDVQPTFDAIAARANVLCDATSDGVFRFDGSRIHLVAHNGWTRAEFEAVRHTFPLSPGRGSVTARAILKRQVVHVHDIAADPEYSAMSIARSGLRTVLSVPMLRDGQPIGAITVDRREVRPFSEGEIGLLKTFAAQAVIAIENVRLFDELRQRQAELRVTFDNMGDGVVMFDEDLRLAAWNRNFQELLDLPDAVLAERPSYSDYLRILASRGEFGTQDIEAEVSRRLENTDLEFRQERTRPDGRVIEVRRNAVPDGGFVLIYSDITERKRSEAEIHAARDAAEAAYRDLKAAQANLIQAEKMASLGQLTAGIAHEIKNPLNFVNNFAGLSVELLDELKETTAPAIATLDEEKRSDVDETIELLTGNLEKIAEHGKRADNIVKSMLEHSRGVTGERREVDLNGLVDEALNLAYHGARAQDQSFNISLERDFAPTLKPIELAPQELTRVFLNLFGNGFYAANKRAKENGNGSFRPILRVATHDLGDAVEVSVRDNGTGIPPEIKDKLFQPFFTTKPTGEGTGLGLSISYDIVTQQHGGTITVESEPGAFTEFTVRLPRQ